MALFESTFEDDLVFVAERVTTGLNIFNETIVDDNKLVAMYGKDEFIALFLTPYDRKPNFGRLRLRTKDMAATWENVPVGFSQINESKALLSDMRQAAHPSPKRNALWYMEKEIKDVIGDRVVFTELRTNKGYLFEIGFTNGYTTYLSVTKDDSEYRINHDDAKLYVLVKKNREPLSESMTADECILMLINIAMQSDMRTSKFVQRAVELGGKTKISNTYRTEDESFDEVKAIFNNGYAMKLQILNDEILVEILGQYEKQIYHLDFVKFEDIESVCKTMEDVVMEKEFKL